MNFDLIIKNGNIIDGSGKKSFHGDIGIIGDKITAIGKISLENTKHHINANGLTVSPGFIDTHTHSEGDLLVNPKHEYGIRQGITTEFIGIDGMSIAPLSHKNYLIYRKWLSGLLGKPPKDIDTSSIKAFLSNYHKKVAVNTAYLVPLGAIRLELVGFNDVPLNEDLITKAKKMISNGFADGAIGFSTGSAYYPGIWSTTSEILELCSTVQNENSIYMVEPRSILLERAFENNGVKEALHIARKTNVPIHFAHHRTTEETAGNPSEIMTEIDKAKEEGVDISLDIYPYPSGSTIPISFLPSNVQNGGPDSILEKLKNKEEKQKIVEYLDNSYSSNTRPLSEVSFSYLANNPHLEGESLVSLTNKSKKSFGELLTDILLEEELEVGYVMLPPNNPKTCNLISEDSMKLLSRDDYMVCSDITAAGSMSHPRSFGAFPRFLGRLRREFNLISLENMIHKMTGFPAERFKLSKRGLLKEGFFADIVIFNPDTIIDTATYDSPRQFPIGIEHVIVNGTIALEDGHSTGSISGYAIS